MTYFKIVSDTGETVKVEAFADPVYVRWQERPPMLVRCKEREAEGLLSTDNNTIYQLEGKQLNGVESDELLSAVVISEAEYDEYAATQDTDDFDDDSGGAEEDPQQGTEMTKAQMCQHIADLEADSKEASERIEFLENCLLEMSEAVYGGD